MTKHAVVSFLRLRRKLRDIGGVLHGLSTSIRCARRAAVRLEAGTPFDQARAVRFRRLLEEMDVLWQQGLDQRSELGSALLELAPDFDLATTPGERFELLNINVADRADIGERNGLVMLVAGYVLEDSAERRRQEFNDGPLFNAVHLLIVLKMSATAAGRAATDKIFTEVFGEDAFQPPAPKKTCLTLVGAPTTQPGEK
ncbi:hypothetical protein [Rugamonas rubra]|uniref:Uncharacterized protein n=1 Tax=Rugamonas rubra TaxID=758825 RepID=A0A1I4SIX1_9BURK|nr:hypothetical protein [Rugamonas rubra]SFM64436.1 hypothetical protein SAMN02982985_04806 [Rugamonas rubra]